MTAAAATAATAIIGSPPVPSGTADTILWQYYAPDSRLMPGALALVGSASTRIQIAAASFCSGSMCAALCKAASTGIAVTACLSITGGSNSCGFFHARQLVASGGTVYIGNYKHSAANRFINIDSTAVLQGTYYWSANAVQQGNVLTAVSGTNANALNESVFGILTETGTRYTASAPPGNCMPTTPNNEPIQFLVAPDETPENAQCPTGQCPVITPNSCPACTQNITEAPPITGATTRVIRRPMRRARRVRHERRCPTGRIRFFGRANRTP